MSGSRNLLAACVLSVTGVWVASQVPEFLSSSPAAHAGSDQDASTLAGTETRLQAIEEELEALNGLLRSLSERVPAVSVYEGGPGAQDAVQEWSNPAPGRTLDMAILKEQAARVADECPELFAYLVERDLATVALARKLVRAIPDPGRIPPIRIPFINFVVEVLEPQAQCPPCARPREDDPLWLALLTPQQRAALCDICRNGIYLRGSGIGRLSR